MSLELNKRNLLIINKTLSQEGTINHNFIGENILTLLSSSEKVSKNDMFSFISVFQMVN